MEVIKQVRVELSGSECEKIIADYVEERMNETGYKMDYSRNESETPWPDMFYRGSEIKGINNG